MLKRKRITKIKKEDFEIRKVIESIGSKIENNNKQHDYDCKQLTHFEMNLYSHYRYPIQLTIYFLRRVFHYNI